jgi:hypothetical protein
MTYPIQPGAPSAISLPEPAYEARRNFFNFFGIRCRIATTGGQSLFFVKLKAFRLKEDITLCADEALTQPLLSIKARQIIDFSAAYDVVDLTTQARVGALRRRGLKSLLRDEWEILDPADQVIGVMQEDSQLMALLRRFLSSLIPQHYHITVHNQPAAVITGTWNPFIVKHKMDLSADRSGLLDQRLALAASVLLMTVEGKQG